jgi:hypothetical protein
MQFSDGRLRQRRQRGQRQQTLIKRWGDRWQQFPTARHRLVGVFDCDALHLLRLLFDFSKSLFVVVVIQVVLVFMHLQLHLSFVQTFTILIVAFIFNGCTCPRWSSKQYELLQTRWSGNIVVLIVIVFLVLDQHIICLVVACSKTSTAFAASCLSRAAAEAHAAAAATTSRRACRASRKRQFQFVVEPVRDIRELVVHFVRSVLLVFAEA